MVKVEILVVSSLIIKAWDGFCCSYATLEMYRFISFL